MGICKDCRKPITLEYVTKNKELISYKRTKKYYLNHEENLIKDRNRIKSERVKRNEYSKTYYQNNKEKINIFITHRISSIKYFDQIIIMREGKIIEQGQHDDLLLEKGLYYAMWRQQIGERK